MLECLGAVLAVSRHHGYYAMPMINLLEKLHESYLDLVWRVDLTRLSPVHRGAVNIVRLVSHLALELTKGHLTLRAMSLVYTTLLSLVPFLAVSFSVLKAFGVHNQMEPLIRHFFEPLGERGIEFGHRILSYVENVQVGVLGSLGLVLLLYTVVSLVQKVEEAFNFIWHIRRPRRLVRRFSDYISVIMIGPVLIFTALGITAAVMGSSIFKDLTTVAPIAVLIHFAESVLPYILVCAAFTFVYIFLPNTKVRFHAALIGGLVAGIFWQSSGWAFGAFISSSTKYTAIYSSFAIVIMFMIWLYVSWLILLLGAQTSYYVQNPDLLKWNRDDLILGNEGKEKMAIFAMFLISYNYYHQQAWWSLESLSQRMNIPAPSLQPILSILEKNGLICESGEDPPTYFPARDIETIKLASVIVAIRHDQSSLSHLAGQDIGMNQINIIMQRIDTAIDAALDKKTFKDMVLAMPETSES